MHKPDFPVSTRLTAAAPWVLRSIALAALAVTGSAHAVDLKSGDWDLSVGGFINAYYTHTSCSGNAGITGLALSGQALGCGGKSGRTIVGNGLLPNALITTAKTHQDGYDISATLMIGAAVASGDPISNNNNVDVRQGFLTFGNADMGTVKLGRDYGLFGANAILSDMTLIGAGAPVAATQRNRVTLGHIGAGYTYLGHYGQVAYTTPSFGGVKASVSVNSPVDDWLGVYTAKQSPQLQARVDGAMGSAKWWVSAKQQRFAGNATTADFTMNGVEAGGSVTLGSFGLLANLQSGKGLGILADADSGSSRQRNTFVQGTYQATSKMKVGLSWGQSKLNTGTGAALKSNSNITAGAYYGLTKSLTLVGELSQGKSKPFGGADAKMNGVAAGAILFF